MINPVYVEMLSYKIFDKEINPTTNQPFEINDIKKEEYKEPVLLRVVELENMKKESEQNAI